MPTPPAPRDAAHVSVTAMADLHFGRFAAETYAPVLTAAAPLSGPAGTVVRISGRHLNGWVAAVTLSGRPGHRG